MLFRREPHSASKPSTTCSPLSTCFQARLGRRHFTPRFKPLPFATGDHGIDRFWRLPWEGNPVCCESPTDTRIWVGKPVPTHLSTPGQIHARAKILPQYVGVTRRETQHFAFHSQISGDSSRIHRVPHSQLLSSTASGCGSPSNCCLHATGCGLSVGIDMITRIRRSDPIRPRTLW